MCDALEFRVTPTGPRGVPASPGPPTTPSSRRRDEMAAPVSWGRSDSREDLVELLDVRRELRSSATGHGCLAEQLSEGFDVSCRRRDFRESGARWLSLAADSLA